MKTTEIQFGADISDYDKSLPVSIAVEFEKALARCEGLPEPTFVYLPSFLVLNNGDDEIAYTIPTSRTDSQDMLARRIRKALALEADALKVRLNRSGATLLVTIAPRSKGVKNRLNAYSGLVRRITSDVFFQKQGVQRALAL